MELLDFTVVKCESIYARALSLDDNELMNGLHLLGMGLGKNGHLATFARRTKSGGGSAADAFAVEHDYVVAWAAGTARRKFFIRHDEEYLKRYAEEDEEGRFFWDTMERSSTATRPYVIEAPDGTELRGRWFRGEKRFRDDLARGDARIMKLSNGSWSVQFKQRLAPGRKLRSLMHENEYKSQPADLGDMGLGDAFSYPKTVFLMERLVESGTFFDKSSAWVADIFAGSGTTGHAVLSLNRSDGGQRRYILVEMGDHFDSVLKPRLEKVIYCSAWKDGKPARNGAGISHMFKYIRLESYEDCLNNLVLSEDAEREKALAANPELRRGYMLKYMLDVETRGSASLLNIDRFADPTAYTLRVKKPGTDEYVDKAVDLIETFNYLLGLRVEHMAAPETLTAEFARAKDPDLPEDQHTRLTIKGKLKRDDNGGWWFRRIEGWVPRNVGSPDDGQQEKVLIIWRKLTGDLEQDNAVLDAYCLNLGINTLDFEYDTIYVNGSNNLPNLKRDEDKWKVRLIEEDFHRLMWDVEDV